MLLDVSDLTVTTRPRARSRSRSRSNLVERVSFSLDKGERLGLIGESGSGKSLTALSLMGLLPDTLEASGSARLDGTELLGAAEKALRPLRGKRIAMVFQEPMNALDPLMRVGRQLDYTGRPAAELLELVGLPASFAQRFPHELSGGQRQRVLIAMAMAARPDVLICDEPTTALDATSEDEVLGVIENLTAEFGTAVLFISHDLAVVRRMSDNVAVMQRGHIVEHGTVRQVFDSPAHDYTRRLINASRPAAPATVTATGDTLIALDKVSKRYRDVAAVDEVSLTIQRGDRIGVVGGSGSGKTTLVKMIAGLIEPTSGTVTVNGRVQMVFQDPQGSLNPRLKVGDSIAEGLLSHERKRLGKAAVRAKVGAALEEVGLSAADADRYPHEFSGGQRQRISIARALIGDPDIVLADEAVSALDVSVRNQVLELLKRAVDKHGATLMFISHDLAVVRGLCPEVAVMNQGRLVDSGLTEEIWVNPAAAYTSALIAAEEKNTLEPSTYPE
ncbi:ABC transporter ATP-binding protein [Corynebacterium incognita]|uniref:ABC transporter ATP-binding protein n=2 Tax=Corynebacterium incognita TaxID=2754725 RepID=A0A7G7CQY2_9CORY|nr:ABC transporter ATP-binding protein [Corynebacterium incognita]QNE89998.1 ABC transporter ATP-binding protein [Corynebacterium incognita]